MTKENEVEEVLAMYAVAIRIMTEKGYVGWMPFGYESLKGGLIVTGGVPRPIQKGPRKGQMTWDAKDSSKCVVSSSDCDAYERDRRAHNAFNAVAVGKGGAALKSRMQHLQAALRAMQAARELAKLPELHGIKLYSMPREITELFCTANAEFMGIAKSFCFSERDAIRACELFFNNGSASESPVAHMFGNSR